MRLFQGQNQVLKNSRVAIFPVIIAVRKLGNVFPKVLRADVDMGSPDAPLYLAPIAFQRINMVDAVDVLLGPVLHLAVPVAPFSEVEIGGPFVG